MSILNVIGMIPKGGRFAKSVVNFVHKVPENWGKFKSAIQQIEGLLKQGKVKLDGKQKTIFETNKNILKNHEKVTKKVEVPPPVKKPEDYFKGWTPTLHQRSNLRNVYKELDPPISKYTAEMEKIDEELDALVFGGDKYSKWSEAEKAKLFKKLQADMKKLIDATKKEDVSTLSLSQINKKSHALQKRIREIADNPNIEGTVYSGPKRDMIEVIYKEREPLDKARQVITKRNSELKYGKKYPVLDPENDAFIVLGLDERGNPIKISRFTGKFSATKDSKTGDLTSAEGTSFYDKWNAKTGTFRKEGEEVFHETLNRDGKVIMSNPEYKLPKTQRLDIQTEFYTDLSTRDLFKKGYKLKDIDMIVKGRKVREYLDKTKSKDTSISMHEQTSTNEIGAVMEDLYHRGDDVYKMSIEEWVKKIPEYFAGGGRVAYGEGTGGISNFFKNKLQKYTREGIGEAQEKWLKEKDLDMTLEEWQAKDLLEKLVIAGKLNLTIIPGVDDLEKGVDYASGGIADFRQGYRSGKAVELVTKLPEFLKFVEKLLIKASNEIRQGIGKWKGLDDAQKVAQHDNLTKLATNFQKTKKFDPKMNEYFGIDAEKAFIEAQAQVKKGKIWKSSEGETQGIAMGYSEAELKGLDQAMAKGTALSDAMKALNLNPASSKDYFKFEKLVSEGMIGFSRELKEQIIRAKYGDVVNKELLNQMLTDSNPQRLSEVMGTIDEGVIMHEKGMGTDEIINTLKESFKRRPNAEGGLIPGYATGGVSNLFRSR